MFMKNTTI
jgi:hypothetical protein